MTNVVQMNEIENKTNETAAVSNYALRIKEKLTVAATAWKEVAQLFAEAANEFGLQSDAMRSLLKQTSFSESKAVKLIAIANSERLQENADTFECVDAWTVLYAITTLKDDEFERLLEKVDAEAVITQSTVNSVKDKTVSEVDNYMTVFDIQIDENALKSRMFGEDEYNELMTKVKEIQNTVAYVRVQKTKRYENEAARFTDDVAKEMSKAIQTLFVDESKNSTVSDEDKELAREAMEERDYELAFEFLNSIALDEDQQRSDALNTVREKRETKFTDAVKAHDACAFTDIKTAA
jgi:hypothetical protein